MFEIVLPGDEAIRKRLDRWSRASFSYVEVGALEKSEFPPGYTIDRHSVLLGNGVACYERAKTAVQRWEMFNVSWVRLHPNMPPADVGSTVGISACFLGLWHLNFCRVAYKFEQRGKIERFGFALGTLPGHVLAGEEEFCVEWDRSDDSVHYKVCAFSRPSRTLFRLGYPVVRQLQKRFARDSHEAMVRASAA